jgi:hypothetical protein
LDGAFRSATALDHGSNTRLLPHQPCETARNAMANTILFYMRITLPATAIATEKDSKFYIIKKICAVSEM